MILGDLKASFEILLARAHSVERRADPALTAVTSGCTSDGSDAGGEESRREKAEGPRPRRVGRRQRETSIGQRQRLDQLTTAHGSPARVERGGEPLLVVGAAAPRHNEHGEHAGDDTTSSSQHARSRGPGAVGVDLRARHVPADRRPQL